MKTVTGILAIGAIAFSASAFAQVTCNGTTSCQGPANELIRSVFAAESGGQPIILINSPQTVAQLPCTGANGGDNVRLGSENAAFRETYATVLTAVASQANVVVRVTNASSNNGTACELQFVQLLTQ